MDGKGTKNGRNTAGTFHCEECGQTFTFKTNLHRHIVEAHVDGPYTCSTCHRTFSRKNRLDRHKCGPRTEYRAGTQHRTEYSAGTQRQSTDRPLKCEECGRAFSKPESLAVHTALHSEHSPSSLVCGVCNMLFTDRCALKRHMNIHLVGGGTRNTHLGLKYTWIGDKPFVCVECNRQYSHRCSLNKHMRVYHCNEHQGEEDQAREEVNTEALPEFQNQSRNKCKDYKARSVIRRYECKECIRRFTTRYILKNHLVTHTKERQYRCEECGKAFARKDILTAHTRRHFPTIEMTCDHCGKVFLDKGSLRQHILIHLPKQHKCEKCSRKFTYKAAMLKHVKSIHSSEEEL